jgi:LacI family transcriptional regulator
MQPSGVTTPTIYDVAERAGVSIATVSRVLNGTAAARPKTYEQVMTAVRELRFVPNNAARGLSQGLKKVVGIVFAGTPADDHLLSVEEESLLFVDAVVRGAEAAAQRLGYSLLLNGAGSTTGERTVAALTGKVDGLIVLDQVLPDRRVAPLAKRTPMVLLAGSGRTRSAYTVRVDNAGAMVEVAAHLVERHGLRRLAFMSGRASSPDSTVRAQSFVQSAVALGAEVAPLEPWRSDWTSGGAVQTIRAFLAADERLPDAIVCANDQMALGVIHALNGSGHRVPADVAVAGFDDISLARHLSPSLTTVRQPSRQLGRAAVEVLIDVIEGRPPTNRDIVLPTQLKVRGSCGCDHLGDDDLDAWRVEI